MCDLWKYSPLRFIGWALDTGWKPGLRIGRMDKDKDYSPDNCRLMTHSEDCKYKRPYSKSGYKGVYKTYNRCQATIDTKDGRINVGTYSTAFKAARVRDLYIIKRGLDMPVQTLNKELTERWNCIRTKREP